LIKKEPRKIFKPLSEDRKAFISDLAEFIHEEYRSSNGFDPFRLADHIGLKYSIGSYGSYFDGRLEYQDGEFFIFINESLSKSRDRLKFTMAHELGHFFIDDHRNALANGLSPAHSSFTGFSTNSIIEQEADFFAACLLMPEQRFKRDYCQNRKFSFNVVYSLSEAYHTSILATLYRLFFLDVHPMMIIRVSADNTNKIDLIRKSKDFYFYPKHNYSKLPEESALFEAIRTDIWKEKTQDVWTGDWFETKSDKKLYEHLLNYKSYYLSILWKD